MGRAPPPARGATGRDPCRVRVVVRSRARSFRPVIAERRFAVVVLAVAAVFVPLNTIRATPPRRRTASPSHQPIGWPRCASPRRSIPLKHGSQMPTFVPMSAEISIDAELDAAEPRSSSSSPSTTISRSRRARSSRAGRRCRSPGGCSTRRAAAPGRLGARLLADRRAASPQQFERDFARFFGLRHALLVNSGSSANLLALTRADLAAARRPAAAAGRRGDHGRRRLPDDRQPDRPERARAGVRRRDAADLQHRRRRSSKRRSATARARS